MLDHVDEEIGNTTKRIGALETRLEILKQKVETLKTSAEELKRNATNIQETDVTGMNEEITCHRVLHFYIYLHTSIQFFIKIDINKTNLNKF